jgi:lipopolysaccharide transport protein LptA
MKTYLLMLLLLGIAALMPALDAQTNAPDPASKTETAEVIVPTAVQTNGAPDQLQDTIIDSDSATFDFKTRVAVYTGHVQVKNPKRNLTCEKMTMHVPQSGEPDSIVAEGKVVIDALDNQDKPVNATCDRAVYSFQVVNAVTNRMFVLTGNPKVKSDSHMVSGTGDTITYDLVNDTILATSAHMVMQQGTRGQTNASPPGSTETK